MKKFSLFSIFIFLSTLFLSIQSADFFVKVPDIDIYYADWLYSAWQHSSYNTWVDLNNDGLKDLIIIGNNYLYGASLTKVYRMQHENHTFEDVPYPKIENLFSILPYSFSQFHYNFLDLNNDQMDDFIASGGNWTNPSIYLYQQNLNEFINIIDLFPGLISITGRIDSGFLNNDPYPELFFTGLYEVAGTSTPKTQIYQKVNDSYQEINNLNYFNHPISGLYEAKILVADFDQDQNNDLFVCGSQIYGGYNNLARVYFQEKNGTMMLDHSNNLYPDILYNMWHCAAEMLPLNDKNLLITIGAIGPKTSGYSSVYSLVYSFDKNRTMTYISHSASNMFPTEISIGRLFPIINVVDFDHDGDLDFMISGTPDNHEIYIVIGLQKLCSGKTILYQNNNNETFQIFSPTNFYPSGLPNIYKGVTHWEDYDQDGDMDLITWGIQSHAANVEIESISPPVFNLFRNGCQKNYYLVGSACQFCFGYVSADERSCSRCLPGQILNAELDQCQNCPAPLIADSEALNCVSCQRNQYFQNNECLDCPNGKINFNLFDVNNIGEEACQFCPAGQYLNISLLLCQNCPINAISSSNGLECLTCPEDFYVINNQCSHAGESSDNHDALIGGLVGGGAGFLGLLSISFCFICLIFLIILILGIVLIIFIVCLALIILSILILSTSLLSSSGLLYIFKFSKKSLKIDDLIFEEEIGSGSFGTVYRGYILSKEKREVAIKKINVLNEQALNDFQLETEILRNLSHLNIVGFVDAIFNKDVCYLVLEYLSEGSLDKLIKREKISLNMKIKIALDVSYALDYLHQKGIIHRDISCRNVLIAKNNNSYSGKLADFGLSRILDNPMNDGNQTMTNFGPIRWLPIEFIIGKRYSKQGDIYMFGMMLYELIMEKVPFYETLDLMDVVQKIRVGQKPAMNGDFPEEIREILKQMWADVEKDRPSWAEIQSILKEYLEEAGENIIEENFYIDAGEL